MDKAKQLVGWIIIFIVALIILLFGLTGRMGLLTAIAFTPDQIVYGGNN